MIDDDGGVAFVVIVSFIVLKPACSKCKVCIRLWALFDSFTDNVNFVGGKLIYSYVRWYRDDVASIRYIYIGRARKKLMPNHIRSIYVSIASIGVKPVFDVNDDHTWRLKFVLKRKEDFTTLVPSNRGLTCWCWDEFFWQQTQ